MEDRVLRTNQIINRAQDYQTTKLGSLGDNQYLKKENWRQIDQLNKNEFGSYERQKQNLDSKIHQQSFKQVCNRQVEKELNSYNSKLKESYYYDQARPQTAVYQSKEDKQDQIHFKTEDRQRIEQQLAHSSDKYLSKQNGLPFGNRTPMDPKANFIANTPQDRAIKNAFKSEYQYSSLKRDNKLPEYQRIYPETTTDKTALREQIYRTDQKQTQEQSSFQDIERRLQQRREQVEKIAGQQEGRLNYYSKSQEYSQRQQGLEGSQLKMKQFQEQLRNEVQTRLKEQSNKQYNINEDKRQYERDFENKQKNKEILELDQFKYTQLDEKFKQNERKNIYNQDYGVNIRKSNEQTSTKTNDSKYQQISDYGKYHFSQKQEFDLNHDKVKFVDRSIYQNKSVNEDACDLRYQGSLSNESYDRLLYKDKLYSQSKKQQYHAKRESDQSQEIQRKLNLYDKLQQFDQDNKKKYQDGQIYQALKQETKTYDLKQSAEPKNYGQQYDIQKHNQIQEKVEFKRSQFQPEVNQVKVELEKKYGYLKSELAPQKSEFDKKRVFENRLKPEPIQTKNVGGREYLGQKYQQREQYRYGQRHSYHEESSSADGFGLEKGNKRNNNRAIDDILQGTALSKYIEREKNQNKMVDRVGNSKINYQKSPLNDKEQYLNQDRLNKLKRQIGNDRYAINEFQRRQPSDQNLQKYYSAGGGLISQQFGNYDRKERRI
ncbi:unnamed protein product (macronuclear) [Paramecium tetraurelia]|uniref:Uncharacterized protein n=1 Tax=Paramecium tetraurelia TaxID=5888 RepID=A0E072_PARTE|nr:uncharacterized protein GSPATT00021857001 [Paramecium tetraurelia]CAK88689.1 unnamed protein product [Paramecium tetraurelia]|eukprot:XP_001456086.1 hypothetical protein (macronuclear) [Paramecium tetraurelia strain d4-2]